MAAKREHGEDVKEVGFDVLGCHASGRFPLSETTQQFPGNLPEQNGFLRSADQAVEQFVGLGLFRRLVGVKRVNENIRINGVHEVRLA